LEEDQAKLKRKKTTRAKKQKKLKRQESCNSNLPELKKVKKLTRKATLTVKSLAAQMTNSPFGIQLNNLARVNKKPFI